MRTQAELAAENDDLRAQLEAVTRVKRWVASEKTKKRAPPRERGKKIIYVPDMQIKEGVPLQHIVPIGNYIAEKEPNGVMFAGDNADMPSLSSYDRGKLCFEGRRYRSDVQAHNDTMAMLMAPVNKARAKGAIEWVEETLGNHEERILRAEQEDPRMEGMIGMHDLAHEKLGIKAHPFLQVVEHYGIAFSHFFPRASSGSVMQGKRGAPNGKAQLIREGRSAVAGHQQGLDMHCQSLGGKLQWGIIAGSAYLHDEGYLTPQGNQHWRGILVFHECIDGSFHPMVVSLDYLIAKYS